MASYSPIERLVAKNLEKIPWLRELIKLVYKRAVYLVFSRGNFKFQIDENVEISTPYELIGKTDSKSEALFFGYYDKSPWNSDMSKAVFHSYTAGDHDVKIKLFDFRNKTSEVIGSTETWNFQQGAMVQWIGDEHIIYNIQLPGQILGSTTVNIRTGENKYYQMPIQCVNPNGNDAISLNYSRLMKLRPDYGYTQKFSNFSSKMDYKSDGLWLLELQTGKFSMLISLEQLMNNEPTSVMSRSEHKVNHVMYSPDGTRIIFMHRWLGSEGKWSRLYIYDLKNRSYEILLDNKMVSHYSWRNNNEIIAWARYDEQDGYYLINADTRFVSSLRRGFYDKFGDGHPSIASINENLMITDTYPDKSRIRHLLFCNTERDHSVKVGEFFSPWRFENEKRCDLHPRWSPDGNLISIDSAHSGLRKTYVLNIGKDNRPFC